MMVGRWRLSLSIGKSQSGHEVGGMHPLKPAGASAGSRDGMDFSRVASKAEPPSHRLPPSQLWQTIEGWRRLDYRQRVDGGPANLPRGNQRALRRDGVAFRSRHRRTQPINLALEPRHLSGTRLALPSGMLDRLR